MDRIVAREVLIASGVAALAAILLWLAKFLGIAFTTQTYLWSLGVLYGLRVLLWAFRTVKHTSST